VSPSPIAGVLAERLLEVLPRGEFVVRVTDGLVSIDGAGRRQGSGLSFCPDLSLQSAPTGSTEALIVLFEAYARSLQRFLSSVRGKPWPTPFAKPHVEVAADLLYVWWGKPDRSRAVAQLSPMSLVELGV
jgi:hypothetical protein